VLFFVSAFKTMEFSLFLFPSLGFTKEEKTHGMRK
jgi:hypothetical protein